MAMKTANVAVKIYEELAQVGVVGGAICTVRLGLLPILSTISGG